MLAPVGEHRKQVPLSEEATRLLRDSASDNRIGGFLVSETMGGLSVQANGVMLLEHGANAREQAVWQDAINGLYDYGLTDGSSGAVHLTNEGYNAADQLAESDDDGEHQTSED